MKKNNKGFSLVELIVVVLILGILAVAVTPQIMNWVDTSKKNTDSTTVESIEVAAQAAVLDFMQTAAINGDTYEVKFKADGTLDSFASTASSETNTGLGAKIQAAVGDVSAPKSKAIGTGYYQITITATTGQVKVALKP